MSTNMTRNDNSTVTLTAVIDGEEWSKAQKKALTRAASHANFKGFRKGKVPASVIKKAFGADSLRHAAAEELAQGALDGMLSEYDINPVGRPSLEYGPVTDESATLIFEVPVEPEVTVEKWKDLGIKKEAVEVKEEEIDNLIKALQERKSESNLVEDQPAKEGDTVEIDFAGSIDGVPFEGGSAENQSLKLGSHTMIPGFEEQIVGMKPEEVKDITVTFPSDYPAPDLAGKEAVFKITMHDIYEPVLPAADDELAKKQDLIPGQTFETMDDLKKAIRDVLEKNAATRAEDEYMDKIFAALREQVNVTVPEAMVEDEIDNEVRQAEAQLAQQGLKLQQYLSYMNRSMDDFRDMYREPARNRVLNSLILSAIAREENLSVSDEEIEKELDDLAKQTELSVDELKKRLDMKAMKRSLLYDKATDVLMAAQSDAAEGEKPAEAAENE